MALTKMENIVGEGRFEGESQELCIGHVKFEMLIRYPSIGSVFSPREKLELRIYTWGLSS